MIQRNTKIIIKDRPKIKAKAFHFRANIKEGERLKATLVQQIHVSLQVDLSEFNLHVTQLDATCVTYMLSSLADNVSLEKAKGNLLGLFSHT